MSLLSKIGRFLRLNKKKLSFIFLGAGLTLLASLIGFIETKSYVKSGVKGIKEAVQKVVDAASNAIAAITYLDGHTLKKGVGYLTSIAGLLWSGLSYLVYGGSYYIFSGLILTFINLFYLYSAYVPDGWSNIFSQTIEEIDATSYTSVGQTPPEEVIEEIAEQKELPVEQVREKYKEKADQNKIPTVIDKAYSIAATGVVKTAKTTEKVVKKVENVTTTVIEGNFGNIFYWIIAILGLVVLIKLL